ncbi:hypothetical protein Moror_12379 [Moniliophthora roreri MCA 2997]|uniref:Uncharacterized protein n=2 Tax=Moniliophthora roreri TaxID=221103 RepID=V2XSQ6_MONRO|nr:hypothetical protein Moror_12379 [Moniliophthora roreri MCA 2997]
MQSTPISLSSTEELLKQLEQRKAALLSEVKQIDIQIQSAQLQRATLINQDAPVSKLPVDLLSAIFLMIRNQDTHRSKNFHLVASHVCSSWRAVVVGTPLLWSDIHINLSCARPLNQRLLHSSIDPAYDRFTAHLVRSSDVLFNFTMSVNGAFDFGPFLSILSQHIHRCRTLFLRISNHPSPVSTLSQHLGNTAATNLQTLDIHIPPCCLFRHNEVQFDNITQPVLFRQGAGSPALQSVRLTGIAGPLLPPLAQITTLHLHGTQMQGVSCSQFFTLLQNTPLLINLSLDDVFVYMPSFTPPSPSPKTNTLAPHLRSLRIRCPDDYDLQPFLSSLTLDNIHSLCLSQIESFRPILFPNTKSLILESCSITTEEVGNLILAFPALESFTIISYAHEVVFFALGFPGEPTWWPNLRTLCVKDMQQKDFGMFMKMLRNRQNPERSSAPLKVLRLDKRDKGLLRTKGHLDEIYDLVPVVERDEDAREPWPAGHGYDDPDDGFWSC